MAELIELKPCPFCGGKAKVYYAPTNAKDSIPCYRVCCEQCHTMIGTTAAGKTDFFRTVFDAIVAWNRRNQKN